MMSLPVELTNYDYYIDYVYDRFNHDIMLSLPVVMKYTITTFPSAIYFSEFLKLFIYQQTYSIFLFCNANYELNCLQKKNFL